MSDSVPNSKSVRSNRKRLANTSRSQQQTGNRAGKRHATLNMYSRNGWSTLNIPPRWDTNQKRHDACPNIKGFKRTVDKTRRLPMAQSFNIVEATIDDIHAAYKSGQLTCRQLVQMYLDRIEAFDKKGPAINAIITTNSDALKEADRLDAAYKASGPVGPLHGIPVIVKDQADVKGMPTTLGSVLFKDYYPDRDSFVAENLRKAGAVILGKATLGELGGGDTHGSLFGSTRNPYDMERTVGGSSGGSAAAVSANFSTVGVGQEGLASIRRPSTWNSIVGMRTTAGLVSRGGVYSGWPEKA